MATGYKPARDQADLTRLVDLNAIRNHKTDAFVSTHGGGIHELVAAVRSGNHAITPMS